MSAPAGTWAMPPCTTCGADSVSATRWPDGRYIAACEAHLDGGQLGLFVERRVR